MRQYPIVLLVLFAACAHRLPTPLRSPTSLSGEANPVYEGPVPFADPAVLKAKDGWFYAYATQSRTTGQVENVQCLRSRDLLEWERLPDCMPRKPEWASAKQNFWAPHVELVAGRYVMYISAEQDETGYCVGAGTSDRPQGPFTEFRRLVCGPSFENIDPMAFRDPVSKKLFLYWGSAHLPLVAQELSSDGLSFENGSRRTTVLENTREPRGEISVDGFTYGFGTQMGPEQSPSNVQLYRSENRLRWEKLPEAMPRRPEWARGRPDHWAPQVVRAGEEFLMYLSVPHENGNYCLTVSRAVKVSGPYEHLATFECSPSFRLVNPYLKEESGKALLVWEHPTEKKLISRALGPDLKEFSPESDYQAAAFTDEKLSFTRQGYENLVEGAWVTYKHGFYYLYYSGDDCCSDQAHYAVSVARSRHPLGPFEKKGVILKGSGEWLGPGHNSVVEDSEGAEWLVYHAIPKERFRVKVNESETEVNRVLMIDRIRYTEDGWPVLESVHPRTRLPAKPVP